MAKKMIEVSFGGVSIGDETVSIGVTVDRGRLDLDDAECTFCGRRITGVLHKNRDGKGQKRIGNASAADDQIEATFDVKRIAVSPKKISLRLQFNRNEVEDSEIANFAKKEGQLEIAKVNELPETPRPPDAPNQKRMSDPEGDDNHTDHPDVGPQPKPKRKKKPAMAPTSNKTVLDN